MEKKSFLELAAASYDNPEAREAFRLTKPILTGTAAEVQALIDREQEQERAIGVPEAITTPRGTRLTAFYGVTIDRGRAAAVRQVIEISEALFAQLMYPPTDTIAA